MTSPSPTGGSTVRRLASATLAEIAPPTERPTYDRSAVSPGIVHIGLGSFSRAHLAVYTEDRIAAGESEWGIIGVDPLSPALRDALLGQDCLYTLVVRAPEADRLRVVGSVLGAFAMPDDTSEILDRMTDPRTRITSLTVSEKGYCQDAATGTLDEAHPAIIADLANPTAPRSVPGLLTEALRRRRSAGLPPFTVLCCDNLSENGIKVRRMVARFAALRDPGLGRFVAEHVAFPCTMVDRITPATRAEDRAAVEKMLGFTDAWPVVTEPFRQWVVEDNFPLGRPAWEQAGATLVGDVLPFELMKLRCLNGAHSALAYLGVVAGYETVFAGMTNPQCAAFIHRLWSNDLAPTVPPVPGIDVTAYTRELETRFTNPSIQHRLLQISSDGSQKLPPRLLEPALERLRVLAHPRCIAFLVAAWMRFLLGRSDAGVRYDIADPIAARLTAIAHDCGGDATRLASGLFKVSEIFTPDVLAYAAFRNDIVTDLRSILDLGMTGAMAAFLARA